METFFYGLFNLYIRGSSEFLNMPLSTTGHRKRIGARALFIKSRVQDSIGLTIKSFPQGSADLFIKSYLTLNDGVNLFQKSFPELSIPLSITGLEKTFHQEYLSLNIYGGTNIFYSTFNLHTRSFPENYCSLFINVANSELKSKALSLYILSDYQTLTSSGTATLFLENKYVSVTKSLDITIVGAGTTFNARPSSGSMNLYIEREVSGCWGHFPMVIHGGDTYTNNITMSMWGKTNAGDGVNLSMPNTKEKSNYTIQLYTHGFEE